MSPTHTCDLSHARNNEREWWYQRTHGSIRLPNVRRREAGMWKEPQRDRAQQEQALTQPISVRTPSCRSTQMCHTRTHTHSPHICFISSCSPCKYACWGWGRHFRLVIVWSHKYLFMCILLSLLTFAILRVSQHICVAACKERVTKVEQQNMLVSVVLGQHRNESTIENMSVWHTQKTRTQSWSGGAELINVIHWMHQASRLWQRKLSLGA